MKTDDKECLYKKGFQHGSEAASRAMFFLVVGLVSMFFIMVYFIYHYEKQKDRAEKYKASNKELDALRLECDSVLLQVDSTFEKYYFVDKKDIKLINTIHLDTTDIGKIYLDITPQK